MQAATCYALTERRRRRPFFLTAAAQHVKSAALAREIGRGAVALAALLVWGGLLVLLAG